LFIKSNVINDKGIAICQVNNKFINSMQKQFSINISQAIIFNLRFDFFIFLINNKKSVVTIEDKQKKYYYYINCCICSCAINKKVYHINKEI